jgi:hypothetical protein
MVDFSKLLSKPLDEISKPKPLPVGTYTGLISAYEYKESNSEKKTPYVRFTIKITGATDDIEPSDLDGVELTKKQLRKDFYLTEDAQYRMKEFLESAGISTSGRSLGETIPDAVNLAVLVGVTQRSGGGDGTEIFNDVNTLSGA